MRGLLRFSPRWDRAENLGRAVSRVPLLRKRYIAGNDRVDAHIVGSLQFRNDVVIQINRNNGFDRLPEG